MCLIPLLNLCSRHLIHFRITTHDFYQNKLFEPDKCIIPFVAPIVKTYEIAGRKKNAIELI